MPKLRPALSQRDEDPRSVGRKIGRNTSGILAGLAATGPSGAELEGGDLGNLADTGIRPDSYDTGLDTEGEDITTPLSANHPTQGQYPHAKQLSGWDKFADTLGGGRVGRQVSDINARSALAQAASNERYGLEQAKFDQGQKMEWIKSQNAKDLAVLKQHLDVLQALGLPYTEDNISFVQRMAQQPVDYKPGSLSEEDIKSNFLKQGVTNEMNRASGVKSVSEADKATEEANKLRQTNPLVASETQANIESTKAKTRGEVANAIKQEAFNEAGIFPENLTSGYIVRPGNQSGYKAGIINKPLPPSLTTGPKGELIPSPAQPGGIQIFDPSKGTVLGSPATPNGTNEEPRIVNGRRAIFDATTKQFKRWE